MTTFKNRLIKAMEAAELDQSSLAKKVGLTPQSIQYLCKSGSGSRHLTAIADALDVDPKWLATGVGSMAARESDAPPIIDPAEWQALNPKVRSFIEDTLDKIKTNQITLNDVTFLHLMADKFSASNRGDTPMHA
jgi:transcriptional regulator with XRE-family HTH domain